jgi:hypothetical protein
MQVTDEGLGVALVLVVGSGAAVPQVSRHRSRNRARLASPPPVFLREIGTNS